MRTLVLLPLLGLLSFNAFGVVLSPGPGTFAPTAFTAADLGGLVATTGPIAVSTTHYSGTLVASVHNDGVAGGATDGLVFVYTFTHTGAGTETLDPVNRITHTSFAGAITDVGTIANGGQFATTVDRQSASTVGFSFPSPDTIASGESSYVMVVKTNALYYKIGTTNLINGDIFKGATFAPDVPEPTFYGVMALGLAGLFAAKYRRRQV